jgi:hypothetical protein
MCWPDSSGYSLPCEVDSAAALTGWSESILTP